MRSSLFAAVLLLSAHTAVAAERVVPLGGDIAEIVFALGEGAKVVCVDQTATYPPSVRSLPQVGYFRNLGAEGVLSCRPDIVLASAETGPPPLLLQLRDAGVRVIPILDRYSLNGIIAKIDTVSAALGIAEKAEPLKEKLKREMEEVDAALAGVTVHPRAVFLLAQGPAGAQAAGAGTAADAILTLARGQNAGIGFHGYKPLSGEAAAALAPDVIVVADFSARALGGVEAMRARPEIALTPAGRSGRIIVVDAMLMLGFGPRTPQAVATLAEALHPGLRVKAARSLP